MKLSTHHPLRRPAFTLIELLVVIAIIAILAGLIMAIMRGLDVKKKQAVAKAELALIQTAIEAYKAKTGSFPPDNPGNPNINPLYFELVGTVRTQEAGVDYYVARDGSGKIAAANVSAVFGVAGFANSSRSPGATDDAASVPTFLAALRPSQTGAPDPAVPAVKILTCSVGWPENATPAPVPNTTLNPWRYVSSRPTKNPNAYDLWVDLSIRGKIYRVGH